jgi:hypothetical protein
MKEEIEQLPVDLLRFTCLPELQTLVRKKIRPHLRQLASMAHTEVLSYLVQQSKVKIK